MVDESYVYFTDYCLHAQPESDINSPFSIEQRRWHEKLPENLGAECQSKPPFFSKRFATSKPCPFSALMRVTYRVCVVLNGLLDAIVTFQDIPQAVSCTCPG